MALNDDLQVMLAKSGTVGADWNVLGGFFQTLLDKTAAFNAAVADFNAKMTTYLILQQQMQDSFNQDLAANMLVSDATRALCVKMLTARAQALAAEQTLKQAYTDYFNAVQVFNASVNLLLVDTSTLLNAVGVVMDQANAGNAQQIIGSMGTTLPAQQTAIPTPDSSAAGLGQTVPLAPPPQ
jgi:hypothetical protein